MQENNEGKQKSFLTLFHIYLYNSFTFTFTFILCCKSDYSDVDESVTPTMHSGLYLASTLIKFIKLRILTAETILLSINFYQPIPVRN